MGCVNIHAFRIITLVFSVKQNLSKAEGTLCEGYATGVSLHMATQKPVAVAFDAGNLEIVAEKLREKFPHAQIVICADTDHAVKRDGRVNNVGVERARLARLKLWVER